MAVINQKLIMKKKTIAKLPLRGSTIWLQDERFYKKNNVIRNRLF